MVSLKLTLILLLEAGSLARCRPMDNSLYAVYSNQNMRPRHTLNIQHLYRHASGQQKIYLLDVTSLYIIRKYYIWPELFNEHTSRAVVADNTILF